MSLFRPAGWFTVIAGVLPGFAAGISSANAAEVPADRPAATAPADPDFNVHVLPILRRYCAGCHNARDAEGEIVLDDHVRLMQGGESGPAVLPGKARGSWMMQLITGRAEPKMPPEDHPGPTPAEIELLAAWIDAGAKPPAGGPAAAGLLAPTVPLQAAARQPIVAVANSPDGRWQAIARPHEAVITRAQTAANTSEPVRLVGHLGVISDLSFSRDGRFLIVASGETGLAGEVTLWECPTATPQSTATAAGDSSPVAVWQRGQVLRGHRDGIYAAAVSPDGGQLATASYDRELRLWDLATGEVRHVITGHNDAVFALAYRPDGQILASASGDRTVKLWNTLTGVRLETFAQPAKEQYSVAFHPGGQLVAAGGVDCRVRVWQVATDGREGTNPLLYARFAHEGPILKVAFSPDGRLLASSSEDRRVKLWETRTMTQVGLLERQVDWPVALAFSADNRQLTIGLLDGSVRHYELDPRWGDAPSSLVPIDDSLDLSALTAAGSAAPSTDSAAAPTQESEPNGQPTEANSLTLPGQVRGVLQVAGDEDLYRFRASRGDAWVFETNAARQGSTADTRIEILSSAGQPVLRAQLQAVRDSWITFRGIDSYGRDVRLEFWEEMDLNQYLYMNGEVVKTFRAPQGPDSGYQMYESAGRRRCYFDTTAMAHPKEQPSYIVEAYTPDAQLVENGLPVFPLTFQNDDDAERKLGNDSRLTFVAPADGEYLVRVTDPRRFGGEKATYELTARRPQPGFTVSVATANPQVPLGSGARVRFRVDRRDHFDGPITITTSGLPAGWSMSSPVVIQAGHLETDAVLTCEAAISPVGNTPVDARYPGNGGLLQPGETQWSAVKIEASAVIGEQTVTQPVAGLGQFRCGPPPTSLVRIVPDDARWTRADGALIVEPGTTITAKLIVTRNGYQGDLRFDVDGLPHGMIVDNIGLSGILVRANETERQIFLTSRPWVPATERLIHAVSQNEGNQASLPIRLVVQPKASGPAAVQSAALSGR